MGTYPEVIAWLRTYSLDQATKYQARTFARAW